MEDILSSIIIFVASFWLLRVLLLFILISFVIYYLRKIIR
ncbi:hypothetical protein WDC_1595 [Paucilactobacillus wasatchensis]|uniref:Uncharacterized protein n=1 Tax=Paucilactobacillus wasatchensis TaxID=1335616 RepID=A0A0D1A547_9LACO|nr:hypothetical protein WDC_1595 [Paucilactobacillus wasatchensis]